jgi:hypothetical protein
MIWPLTDRVGTGGFLIRYSNGHMCVGDKIEKKEMGWACGTYG